MVVVAHYWGIDEVGLIVVPVLLGILGLRWMERRAGKRGGPAEGSARARGDSEEPTDVG